MAAFWGRMAWAHGSASKRNPNSKAPRYYYFYSAERLIGAAEEAEAAAADIEVSGGLPLPQRLRNEIEGFEVMNVAAKKPLMHIKTDDGRAMTTAVGLVKHNGAWWFRDSRIKDEDRQLFVSAGVDHVIWTGQRKYGGNRSVRKYWRVPSFPIL